jgi:hypothetical protein
MMVVLVQAMPVVEEVAVVPVVRDQLDQHHPLQVVMVV